MEACEEPEGYVTDMTDCDDGDNLVNPNVTEIPNGGDKNCDGIDPGDLSVADLQVGDLQIMEVMANPAAVADSDGEWFEVYVSDTLSGTVQLNGLVLSNISASSTQYEILSANLLVSGGDYVTFAKNLDSTANGGLTGDATFAFDLNNTGEVLGLWTEEGATNPIDSVDVDSVGSVSAGAALAKDDMDMWCDAIDTYGDGDLGTPGAMNWDCMEYAADCKDSTDNDGDGTTDCDDSDCSSEVVCEEVDHSEVIDILTSYSCSGCHGTSGGFSLSDLSDATEQSNYINTSDPVNSKLIQKMRKESDTQFGASGNMPLGSSVTVSDDDIQRIINWIEDGAPYP
jgi:cytochrome c551/c552